MRFSFFGNCEQMFVLIFRCLENSLDAEPLAATPRGEIPNRSENRYLKSFYLWFDFLVRTYALINVLIGHRQVVVFGVKRA